MVTQQVISKYLSPGKMVVLARASPNQQDCADLSRVFGNLECTYLTVRLAASVHFEEALAHRCTIGSHLAIFAHVTSWGTTQVNSAHLGALTARLPSIG